MNDERLAELKEIYKDRNLFEELAWGIYWNHSGYTSKQNGEFLNWLCLMAYKALKERPTCKWIFDSDNIMFGNPYGSYKCTNCNSWTGWVTHFCSNCGAKMKGGEEE